MEIRLTDTEANCQHALAKHYENGRYSITGKEAVESLGLNAANFDVVLNYLYTLGVLTEYQGYSMPEHIVVNISPRSMEISRIVVGKQQDKDIYDSVKQSIRKHPFWGRVVLFVVGFGVFVHIGNATCEFVARIIKSFGW